MARSFHSIQRQLETIVSENSDALELRIKLTWFVKKSDGCMGGYISHTVTPALRGCSVAQTVSAPTLSASEGLVDEAR